MPQLVYKILLSIYKTIKFFLLIYAVVFSLAATIGLFWIYKSIFGPIAEVKKLIYNNPAQTRFMELCRKKLKEAGEKDTLYHHFIPLDSISKHLINAVIAAEDDAFYFHPGIDIRAIADALDYNSNHNILKRGGSTITQQLAKNLFLTSEKTLIRKVKELGYTLLLEKYLGKNRILELYLNYAQWGKNIFGAEAAARAYYKKSAKSLTFIQAARLAAILPMPTKLSPLNEQSVFISKRIAVIGNNLYQRRKIDDTAYEYLNIPESLKINRPNKLDSVVNSTQR